MAYQHASTSRDHLAALALLPPGTGKPWTPLVNQSVQSPLRRADGAKGAAGVGGGDRVMPFPLFWYAPDWYLMDLELAGPLAAAVASLGITVGALRSEITSPGQSSALHDLPAQNTPHKNSSVLPRLVPYRPERFGFDVRDLDDALIVDMRLTLVRDPSGRFAFPPAQIARWESIADDDAISGGGWVEAASFPPDVEGIDHLGSKIAQLRQLSPSAAVFVSINPIDVDADVKKILEGDPDGIILRLDRFPLTGLQLAAAVLHARDRMNQCHASSLPLWVVPGDVSVDDAAKLMALGASAVAADSWCQSLRDADFQETSSATAARLGFAPPGSAQLDQAKLIERVSLQLDHRIDRFVGLINSTQPGPIGDRLGTFDPDWAKHLGVRLLG